MLETLKNGLCFLNLFYLSSFWTLLMTIIPVSQCIQYNFDCSSHFSSVSCCRSKSRGDVVFENRWKYAMHANWI